MLYHLLFRFHETYSILNVTRYITFRTAAASITALIISLAFGGMADPEAARVPDRAGDPPRGSGEPSPEGRDADHGRTADPGGRHRADAAVGRPDQRLHLDRRLRHAGLRRDRLRGRLPEGHAPHPPRPAPPLQDGRADRRGPDRRRDADRPGEQGPLQHASHLPVLQGPHPGSRPAVHPVCGAGAGGRVQRRQPDRWPRRARDQHVSRSPPRRSPRSRT